MTDSYEPGDVVILRGAQADEILRRSNLPTESVEFVEMTHCDEPDFWNLRIQYTDRDALLDANAIYRGDHGILAAREGVVPEQLHRRTSLIAASISERLRSSGHLR